MCAAYGFGGMAGVYGAGAAIGGAAGAYIGVSADTLYHAIRGKNIKKKMFTRKSFNQMITSLTDDNTMVSVLRRNPNDQIVVDKDLIDDDQNPFEQYNSSNRESQPDIIRYSFDSLYPYMYYERNNHVNRVDGRYKFYIQDLNSATITMSEFSYQEIFTRPQRTGTDQVDSFGNNFNSYTGTNPLLPTSGYSDVGGEFSEEPAGSWYGSADKALWNQYDDAVKMISVDNSNQVTSSGRSGLISTQNYFNYIILGGEGLNQEADDPLKALNIWSVDLEPYQFKSIIGMMQTGFRDLKLEDLEEIENGKTDINFEKNWEGLPADYADFVTNNLPLTASLEANPGYELLFHQTDGRCSIDYGRQTTGSLKEKCENAGGIWTPLIVGIKEISSGQEVYIPTDSIEAQNMTQGQAKIIQKGFRQGEFKLGKHLMHHHRDFVSNLTNVSLFINTDEQGFLNYGNIGLNSEIKGGTIVKNNGEYYFVRKTHKKNQSNLPV